MSYHAIRLALGCVCLAAALEASAIDTTTLAQSAASPPALAQAPSPAVQQAASDAAEDYKPFALALAGALVMGYIGLRRPPE